MFVICEAVSFASIEVVSFSPVRLAIDKACRTASTLHCSKLDFSGRWMWELCRLLHGFGMEAHSSAPNRRISQEIYIQIGHIENVANAP